MGRLGAVKGLVIARRATMISSVESLRELAISQPGEPVLSACTH